MKCVDILPLTGFFLFLIVIFGRIIYLSKAGIQVWIKATKPNWFLYIFYGVVLLAWLLSNSLFFQINLLTGRVTQLLFSNSVTRISGAIIIIFALLMLLVTLLSFRNSFRFGLHKKNAGSLITTGIFAFSRNPFFISIELFFLGCFLINPHLINALVFAGTIIGIHFSILKEEKFMLETYGEQYKRYQKKVRRYF